MNVTVDQVLALLGSKEVELTILKNEVARLQAELKAQEDNVKKAKEE